MKDSLHSINTEAAQSLPNAAGSQFSPEQMNVAKNIILTNERNYVTKIQRNLRMSWDRASDLYECAQHALNDFERDSKELANAINRFLDKYDKRAKDFLSENKPFNESHEI